MMIAETFHQRAPALLRQDSVFQSIAKRLEGWKTVQPYTLEDDCCLTVGIQGQQRLCLPRDLVNEVLQEMQDRLGHPGIGKTSPLVLA